MCATVVPVTKPSAESAGNPSRSKVHRAAILSRNELAGDDTQKAPCCSHAVESQLTASAPGSAPPFTKPK